MKLRAGTRKKMIDIKDIDLNNPMMVREYSPIAEWKRALIVRLGNLFGLKTLIETGTCVGDTVETVREYFDNIYSVELSQPFYNICAAKFARCTNIHLFFGSSHEQLPNMIAQTKGPVLFFLDAHITGGASAGNGDMTIPEMQIIEKMCPNALVVIDDIYPGPNGTYLSPDGATIHVPKGWTTKFLHGELLLHNGTYHIPERF